jgi:hypothetical protein
MCCIYSTSIQVNIFNPFQSIHHFATFLTILHFLHPSPGFNSRLTRLRGELLELLGAISAAARRQSAEAQKQLQEDAVRHLLPPVGPIV